MRVVPGDQMMYEVPASTLKELHDLRAEVARLQRETNDLLNEVDCRIEHGAESGGHLEYVRTRLRAALGEDA